MTMTRRQLLRNGAALGAAVPVSLSTGWVGQAMAEGLAINGEIRVFGSDRSSSELARGLRGAGWRPVEAGRFDPLVLADLPRGTLAAGFTDEAGMALLTSQLVGRGRILALGRHSADGHRLVSQRGAVVDSLAQADSSWQTALGREYARLAQNPPSGRRDHNLREVGTAGTRELSFLVRV